VGFGVCGYQADHLYAASLKLIFQFCEGAELRRADGCEVCGVGEEDGPFVVELSKMKVVSCDRRTIWLYH